MKLEIIKKDGKYIVPQLEEMDCLPERIIIEVPDETLNLNKAQKVYTDDYLRENWKDFIITSNKDLEQNDDLALYEAYQEYINDKNNS